MYTIISYKFDTINFFVLPNYTTFCGRVIRHFIVLESSEPSVLTESMPTLPTIGVLTGDSRNRGKTSFRSCKGAYSLDQLGIVYGPNKTATTRNVSFCVHINR